jgi:hypothetical protein
MVSSSPVEECCHQNNHEYAQQKQKIMRHNGEHLLFARNNHHESKVGKK